MAQVKERGGGGEERKETSPPPPPPPLSFFSFRFLPPWGGRGALGISGWGCAAGTPEPLTYTRASSAKFCYPILE